jgi:hypothetical protein
VAVVVEVVAVMAVRWVVVVVLLLLVASGGGAAAAAAAAAAAVLLLLLLPLLLQLPPQTTRGVSDPPHRWQVACPVLLPVVLDRPSGSNSSNFPCCLLRALLLAAAVAAAAVAIWPASTAPLSRPSHSS